MEPQRPHRHKTLQELIDFQDIVYTYPAINRPKQRIFVEDYYVGPDMEMEEEFGHDMGIVEQYGVRKTPHAGFFNMVNDSSDNKELPERRDSSVQSFKIVMKNKRDYESDSAQSIASNSSDFRKKSFVQREEIEEFIRKESMVIEDPETPPPVKHHKDLKVIESIKQKQHHHHRQHRQHRQRFNKEYRETRDAKDILKQSNLSRQQKIQKVRQVGCNCKKSHCLKMYCECFHLQIFCGSNCSCKGCGNLQKTVYHDQAVIEALTRNPKAFEQQNPEACFKISVGLGEVKKGCKCKKTKCLKKYCECYNSGQKCGIFCKCQGCENGADAQQDQEEGAMEIET